MDSRTYNTANVMNPPVQNGSSAKLMLPNSLGENFHDIESSLASAHVALDEIFAKLEGPSPAMPAANGPTHPPMPSGLSNMAIGMKNVAFELLTRLQKLHQII